MFSSAGPLPWISFLDQTSPNLLNFKTIVKADREGSLGGARQLFQSASCLPSPISGTVAKRRRGSLGEMERGRCALAAGPLSPDMQPGHIRTDPLCLHALREGGSGKVRGENKSTKADDGMLEEERGKSHGCRWGGGSSIMAVSWGSPPNTHFGLSHHQEESQTELST